jgi:hypothetical protein
MSHHSFASIRLPKRISKIGQSSANEWGQANEFCWMKLSISGQANSYRDYIGHHSFASIRLPKRISKIALSSANEWGQANEFF